MRSLACKNMPIAHSEHAVVGGRRVCACMHTLNAVVHLRRIGGCKTHPWHVMYNLHLLLAIVSSTVRGARIHVFCV